MGEPLDNADAVRDACASLTDGDKFAFGRDRVTVSTVAPTPGCFEFFARADAPAIAFSLHAADDALRRRLVPTARYSLAELRDGLLRALAARPTKRRRVVVECVLIRDVNDGVDDAEAIADFLKPLEAACRGANSNADGPRRRTGVLVNLIPFNAVASSDFEAPTPQAVAAFQQRLRDRGSWASTRTPRGDDDAAACGQLATRRVAAAAPRAPVAESPPVDAAPRAPTAERPPVDATPRPVKAAPRTLADAAPRSAAEDPPRAAAEDPPRRRRGPDGPAPGDRSYAKGIETPTSVTLEPIGVVSSPYAERHGTPRQATVDDPRVGKIKLRPDLKGTLQSLSGFDYVWVIAYRRPRRKTACSPEVRAGSPRRKSRGTRTVRSPPDGPRLGRGVVATRVPTQVHALEHGLATEGAAAARAARPSRSVRDARAAPARARLAERAQARVSRRGRAGAHRARARLARRDARVGREAVRTLCRRVPGGARGVGRRA